MTEAIPSAEPGRVVGATSGQCVVAKIKKRNSENGKHCLYRAVPQQFLGVSIAAAVSSLAHFLPNVGVVAVVEAVCL